MASRPPFYIQITTVKEDSIDLPLVTLPAGTILFRGLKVPKPEDAKYFYRDFLGDSEPGKVCLSPVHNVFFYPVPYVAFGAHDVGKDFTMLQMVVLVHPVNVVCAVSPSPLVRGMGQKFSGDAPWQRCSQFSGSTIDCHPPSAKELDARTYDNCLNPDYQARSGTRGWMALANLDSIKPRQKRWDVKPQGSHSSMGTFIKSLESEIPGEGAKALAWSYVDDHGHAGYPEIALYPYRVHKGRSLITRPCKTNEDAMRLIEKEAAADNLNYLPLATFTKTNTIDMIHGDFSYNSLKASQNNYNAPSAQKIILHSVYEYMTKLQSGIDLPHYGKAKLTFDTRTGFFALDTVVPNIKIPIPKQFADGYPTLPYRFLLMPMETEDEKRRMMTYMLMFRNASPEHFLEKYPLEKGFGVRRAMVFNRYPILTSLFTELGLQIPKSFLEPLDRAGKLYRKDTGKAKVVKPSVSNLPKPSNLSNPPKLSVPAEEPYPAYAPGTPLATTPVFGTTPAGTPPGTPPLTPKGGTRKKSQRGTRKNNKNAASLFTRIWKIHSKLGA
jgi:hypothetical protein